MHWEEKEWTECKGRAEKRWQEFVEIKKWKTADCCGWVNYLPQVNKHVSVSLNSYSEYTLLSHRDSEEVTFYIDLFLARVLWSVSNAAKLGYISALVCRGTTSINHNWDTGNATPRLSPWTITLQPFIVIKINNQEVPYGRDFLQLQHPRWEESARRNKAFKWWIRLEYLFIFWRSLGPLVLRAVVFTTASLPNREEVQWIYARGLWPQVGNAIPAEEAAQKRRPLQGASSYLSASPFWKWQLSITGSPAPRRWKRKWTSPALSGYPVIWKAM